MSDDLIEKCPCSRRRIENLDSMRLYYFCLSFSFLVVFLEFSFYLDLACISESLRKMEVSMENIVDSTDDELHDWCWRIEYSSRHTKCRVILSEEVLIEVDDGIVCLLLIHPMHERMDICMSKYFTELIDDIFETFLVSLPCDMIEESPEKRIRLRDEITSLTSREVIGSPIMIASDEESIDKRLSIEISEVIMREIVEYLRLEGMIEFPDIWIALGIFHHLTQIISDTTSLATHDLSEMTRSTDSIYMTREEVHESILEYTEIFFLEAKN